MSIKQINDSGEGLRISGSVLMNGNTPVIEMTMLDRPLYSTEICSAIKSNEVVEKKTVNSNGQLVITIGDEQSTVNDQTIPVSEINYYMSNFRLEKTLYTSSKMTVDILEKSITVDLIESDQYTNSIDLIKVEKKLIYPGLSAKVDLSVKYSIGLDVYGKDLTFEAFSYDNSLNLIQEDFTSSLRDVSIEYVDGIIRVIPISSEVGECIISNCVITYGCQ